MLQTAGMLDIARRARDKVRPGPLPGPTAPNAVEGGDYRSRMVAEIENFADDAIVHDLPPIFHYWSNTYLLPLILQFGFRHPDDFFVKQIGKVLDSRPEEMTEVVSLGAGNCDTEIRVAAELRALGYDRFVIHCLDVNEAMLARGRAAAAAAGCGDLVRPRYGDFNTWKPEQAYPVVMANQSLHHVLHLEHLFDSIKAAIAPVGGVLITADMIGRNGHQRWPEARAILDEFWQELPDRYKYNRQLRRLESTFMDWDCAQDSFEGIRAQDILALLVERFHFDLFVPFANVITPFIDRGFGHNFDAGADWDRRFIDRVQARDDAAIRSGEITPTQMFAVLSTDWTRTTVGISSLEPERCIRRPSVC